MANEPDTFASVKKRWRTPTALVSSAVILDQCASELESGLEQRVRTLHLAAGHADWQQVVLNGGPPCFHLEDEHFCLRAQRWDGHIVTTDGALVHKFMSLADGLAALLGEEPK